MKISYTVEPLDSEDGWSRLAQSLGGGDLDVIRNTLRHLRVLDAKSYVLEDPYIDRDYSADYLHFYARTFRAHERHCKRVHFFSDDISRLLTRPYPQSDCLRFSASQEQPIVVSVSSVPYLTPGSVERSSWRGRVKASTWKQPSLAVPNSTPTYSALA